MTQNPFEGLGDSLGGGGFDLGALVQQAQQMQEKLADAQQQLTDSVIEGTVAGGAVTVRVSGLGELLGVEIRQGEFDGNDPDELEDLSDVIVAAYREARSKADALAAETMGPLAGGLGGGLPGLGGGPTELGS
ncbi:MAG: YbaB/EbfC family nucleoid-associated protein [Nocardioides sp.]|uniref:YbaB/EbfC family nucleoid-associated protein n=1 Tax=Nocardioides sp. TaxID=35761 RepID=UPI0039E511B1